MVEGPDDYLGALRHNLPVLVALGEHAEIAAREALLRGMLDDVHGSARALLKPGQERTVPSSLEQGPGSLAVRRQAKQFSERLRAAAAFAPLGDMVDVI